MGSAKDEMLQEFARQSEAASDLLSLLANPHRLRILCELLEGERSVSALESVVGLSQSALSQHLAKLREGNIVATRREAQTIHYSVADWRAERVLEVLADIFCKPARDRRAAKGK
ncbi:MAG: metalloregulator ArsR/SmtB family transcription factor [Hyphomicrobiaceae bacterium]|nr:metalloregulator ArsR/SmtB family transcription factor [Hyphomicrobiaceae bacterium]